MTDKMNTEDQQELLIAMIETSMAIMNVSYKDYARTGDKMQAAVVVSSMKSIVMALERLVEIKVDIKQNFDVELDTISEIAKITCKDKIFEISDSDREVFKSALKEVI